MSQSSPQKRELHKCLRNTILMTIYNYSKPISLSSSLSIMIDKQVAKGKDPFKKQSTKKSKKEGDDKFLTPTKFSQEIERLVKTSGGLISYIEAVVTYCAENEIEIETVPKLLSKPLKERLRHEAERLNYMKATSKGVLPL